MALTLARPVTVGVTATRRGRRRDWHAFTAHAILLASVVVLAFPLYYAFVISTQTLSQVTAMPPKLRGAGGIARALWVTVKVSRKCRA